MNEESKIASIKSKYKELHGMNVDIQYNQETGKYVVVDKDNNIVRTFESLEEELKQFEQEEPEFYNDGVNPTYVNENSSRDNSNPPNNKKNDKIDIYYSVMASIINKIKSMAGLVTSCDTSYANCLTGELRDFYNTLNDNTPEAIKNLIDLIMAAASVTESSVSLCHDIGIEILKELEALINGFLNLSDDNIDIYDYVDETQPADISKIIESYERVLNDLVSTYTNLYGNGVPFDKDKINCMLNLFSSLGIFNGIDGDTPHADENGICVQKYNNIFLDVDQTNELLTYINNKDVMSSIKRYLNGEDWVQSGMDTLFGEKLINSYDVKNGNLDFKNERIKNIDSETIFLENYINGCYGTLRRLGKGDYSQSHSDFGNFANDLFLGENISDELFEKLEFFDNTFSEYDGYEGYKVDNKESARIYVLEYIKNKDVVSVYDKVQDDLNNCLTMQNDLKTLSNTVYNYKQAQKLMPYEKYLQDTGYNEYLAINYEDYTLIDKSKLEYLKQEEIALYDYLYNNKGKKLANDYLNALNDMINSRQGLVNAYNYYNSVNDKSLIVADLITVGNGFLDGNMNFIQGLKRFYNPSGVRSALDYSIMYKVGFLDNPVGMYKSYADILDIKKDLNKDAFFVNLSDEERKSLKITYNLFNGVGNMFIPQMVGLAGSIASKVTQNPIFATASGKLRDLLIFQSSAGNSINNALVEGYSPATSYLYGGLAGASEMLFEKIGGIIGIGEDIGLSSLKGFDFVKGYVKSMFREGREEFFQEYFNAGMRAAILGEPLDLTNTTFDALIAGLYGMGTAGIMNSPTIAIKFGGKVYNLTHNQLSRLTQMLNDSADSAIPNDFFDNLDIGNYSYDEMFGEVTSELDQNFKQPKTLGDKLSFIEDNINRADLPLETKEKLQQAYDVLNKYAGGFSGEYTITELLAFCPSKDNFDIVGFVNYLIDNDRMNQHNDFISQVNDGTISTIPMNNEIQYAYMQTVNPETGEISMYYYVDTNTPNKTSVSLKSFDLNQEIYYKDEKGNTIVKKLSDVVGSKDEGYNIYKDQDNPSKYIAVINDKVNINGVKYYLSLRDSSNVKTDYNVKEIRVDGWIPTTTEIQIKKVMSIGGTRIDNLAQSYQTANVSYDSKGNVELSVQDDRYKIVYEHKNGHILMTYDNKPKIDKVYDLKTGHEMKYFRDAKIYSNEYNTADIYTKTEGETTINGEKVTVHFIADNNGNCFDYKMKKSPKN